MLVDARVTLYGMEKKSRKDFSVCPPTFQGKPVFSKHLVGASWVPVPG
jgi:hypothetical protein